MFLWGLWPRKLFKKKTPIPFAKYFCLKGSLAKGLLPHLNRSGVIRQKQFRNPHVLTVRFDSSTNFFHLKIIK